MIIAFDFDKTLDDLRIQILCKKLVSERNEVWVVTARKDNDYNNSILKPVLDRVMLSKYNVIYCNDKPKADMLKMLNADIYIDNINDEFEIISNHSNTIPLLWSSQ